VSRLIVFQSWRVVGGHLERNPYYGIRTPSTIKNDEAWMAAHRAALRLTRWLVLGIVATWAGLWAAALSESTIIVILLGIVGLIAALALSIYTVVIASRTARAADSRDDSSSVTRRAYASGLLGHCQHGHGSQRSGGDDHRRPHVSRDRPNAPGP
jgi:hypothetical protein